MRCSHQLGFKILYKLHDEFDDLARGKVAGSTRWWRVSGASYHNLTRRTCTDKMQFLIESSHDCIKIRFLSFFEDSFALVC